MDHGLFVWATYPTTPSPNFKLLSLRYASLMVWVARIFKAPSFSSKIQREQIFESITLAVTVTINFRMSSRYRSDEMALLISVMALFSCFWVVFFKATG